MHQMVEVAEPKLAKLAQGLSSADRRARWKKWQREGYDGIEINTIGGDPLWSRESHGLDFLADFAGLKALRVALTAIDSLEPLALVADSLEWLAVGGNDETIKASCQPLAQCRRLRSLTISRVPKDLTAIETLTGLEALTLHGMTLKSLDVVRPLLKLERLQVSFGSVPNIEPIRGLKKLKLLELFRVRGVDDLSPVASLPALQCFTATDMKQITVLPDCSSLKALRRIYLDTMNGIVDLSGVAKAPKLEDLIVINSKLEADVFNPIISATRPKRVTVGLASRKAEAAVEARLGARAKSIFGTPDQAITLK